MVFRCVVCKIKWWLEMLFINGVISVIRLYSGILGVFINSNDGCFYRWMLNRREF